MVREQVISAGPKLELENISKAETTEIGAAVSEAEIILSTLNTAFDGLY